MFFRKLFQTETELSLSSVTKSTWRTNIALPSTVAARLPTSMRNVQEVYIYSLTIFAPPLPPFQIFPFQECAEQCCAISAFPLLADANLVCFELRRKAVPPAPVPVLMNIATQIYIHIYTYIYILEDNEFLFFVTPLFLPHADKVRVLKLLSEDPDNYPDAPREGIRRIIEVRCTNAFASQYLLLLL